MLPDSRRVYILMRPNSRDMKVQLIGRPAPPPLLMKIFGSGF